MNDEYVQHRMRNAFHDAHRERYHGDGNERATERATGVQRACNAENLSCTLTMDRNKRNPHGIDTTSIVQQAVQQACNACNRRGARPPDL